MYHLWREWKGRSIFPLVVTNHWGFFTFLSTVVGMYVPLCPCTQGPFWLNINVENVLILWDIVALVFKWKCACIVGHSGTCFQVKKGLIPGILYLAGQSGIYFEWKQVLIFVGQSGICFKWTKRCLHRVGHGGICFHASYVRIAYVPGTRVVVFFVVRVRVFIAPFVLNTVLFTGDHS